MNPIFKEKFFLPLSLALITFFVTTLYSYYSDCNNKKYQLREKKLTLISDLTESYQTYYYHSGFRGMLHFEQMEYVKYFTVLEPEKLQETKLTIKQRILLADTMRKIYPFVYEKMIEGDLKAPVFFKNVHLVSLLFSDKAKAILNEFQKYVPIDKKIEEKIKERLKTNPSKLSESEKDEILEKIQSESSEIFNKLLDELVKEVE